MVFRFLVNRSAVARYSLTSSLSIRPFSYTAITANQWLKIVENVKRDANIAEIDGATLEQWLKNSTVDVHVVDVREREEQVHGVIPGALCLPRGIVDRDIGRYIPASEDKTQLVLYCAGGVRSILAAEAVKRLGYQNVISLRGGMRNWEQEGRPVEKM